MDALPLDEAGKYVAGANLVFLGLVLVYVAIMAGKLSRLRDQIAELAEVAERRTSRAAQGRDLEGERARELA